MLLIDPPIEQPPARYYNYILIEHGPRVKEPIIVQYSLQIPSPDDLSFHGRSTPAQAPGPTFKNLVKRWRRDTSDYSVMARRYAHPAYKAILDMKEKAVPLILNELRQNPDRWFDALERLTNQNPAKSAKTFYEAVDIWIAWGISEDLISQE